MEFIWTKIAGLMNVTVVTETHFCRLCRDQVSAITFFIPGSTYGLAGFSGEML
jgi:hypothetical protein